MEKITYNFSQDFKKVFEILSEGEKKTVQFVKVPVKTGKSLYGFIPKLKSFS
jgi:hypothetical protein